MKDMKLRARSEKDLILSFLKTMIKSSKRLENEVSQENKERYHHKMKTHNKLKLLYHQKKMSQLSLNRKPPEKILLKKEKLGNNKHLKKEKLCL